MTPMEAVRYVARNPYAWPGGYDTFLVMVDGNVLCAACVRKEYKLVLRATRDGYESCWVAAAADCTANTDDEVVCDHCGAVIQEQWKEEGDDEPAASGDASQGEQAGE